MNNTVITSLLVLLVVGGIGYFALNSANTSPAPSTSMEVKKDLIVNDKNMNNSNTIVDVAVNNGNFKTLVAAVQAAGLVETLSGEGPFTVFAPTDAAFAKLPAGTVESLLKDKEKLTAILTYHVVSGKVTAADVVKLSSAKTVNGQEVTVKTDSSGVMINESRVVTADVEASNGVIHVIDNVLLPR